MKKYNKSSPRSQFVHIELRQDTVIDFDVESGAVVLKTKSGDAATENLLSAGCSYMRPSGKRKVVRMWVGIDGRVPLNHVGFEKCYRRFYVVDTNYRELGEVLCCVSSMIVVEASDLKSVDSGTLPFRVVNGFAFLARKGTNPERYGWMKWLESAMEAPDFESSKPATMIVDSELGELGRINCREANVEGEMPLPEGIDMIYASSDVGSEYWPNKLIRICDKLASLALADVVEDVKSRMDVSSVDGDFFFIGQILGGWEKYENKVLGGVLE